MSFNVNYIGPEYVSCDTKRKIRVTVKWWVFYLSLYKFMFIFIYYLDCSVCKRLLV